MGILVCGGNIDHASFAALVGAGHQVSVDARDIGRFTCTAVETGASGAFNLAGSRITWAAFMRSIGATNPVWVSADFIAASRGNSTISGWPRRV